MKIKTVFLIMLLLVGCSSVKSYHTNLIVVETDEVIEKIINRETFLLLVTNDECDPCNEFIDLLEQTAESEQLQMYVLDYADVDSNFHNQLEFFQVSFASWPALLYIENGAIEEGSTYEYSLNPEGWLKWLTVHNLLHNK